MYENWSNDIYVVVVVVVDFIVFNDDEANRLYEWIHATGVSVCILGVDCCDVLDSHMIY